METMTMAKNPLYDLFETNPILEEKGVNIDYGDGTIITVARAGGSNENYLATLEKMSAKYRTRGADLGKLAKSNPEDMKNLLQDVFIELAS